MSEPVTQKQVAAFREMIADLRVSPETPNLYHTPSRDVVMRLLVWGDKIAATLEERDQTVRHMMGMFKKNIEVFTGFYERDGSTECKEIAETYRQVIDHLKLLLPEYDITIAEDRPA